MAAAVFLFISSLSMLQLSESKLCRNISPIDPPQWDQLDLEFGQKVSFIHHGVSNGNIPVSEGTFQYTKELKTFLESKPEFIDHKTAYYQKNPPKTIDEARKQKNLLRRLANRPNSSLEDKRNIHQALKHYNFLLKQ